MSYYLTLALALLPQIEHGSRFGHAVLALADINGNGSPDFAVGAPTQSTYGCFNAGAVLVFDGETLALLAHWQPGENRGLGHTLKPVPDVDKDGIDDALIGFELGGFSEVRSAVSGAILRVLKEGLDRVHPIGDLDGDGVGDLLLTGEQLWRVLAGGTWNQLAEIPARAAGHFFPLGDLNGDGLTDGVMDGAKVGEDMVLLMSQREGGFCYTSDDSAPWLKEPCGMLVNAHAAEPPSAGTSSPLLVAMHSDDPRGVVRMAFQEDGAWTQRQIFPSRSPHDPSKLPFGYAMVFGDDLDGDKVPDPVISGPLFLMSANAAAYGSRDGGVLWDRGWMDAGATSSVPLAVFDDMDGDGFRDVLAGTADFTWHGRVFPHGSVRLLSAATGEPLWTLSEPSEAACDPFELATAGRHRILIASGTEQQRELQMDLLAKDPEGVAERKILVLNFNRESPYASFAGLGFDVPRAYVEKRFEIGQLDFELTLVGFDGVKKEFRFKPTATEALWDVFDAMGDEPSEGK